KRLLGLATGLLLAGGLVACANAAASVPPTPMAVPTSAPGASRGEQLFNQTCAACHGVRGTGNQTGPPLVHKIYEPSHHSDAAFLLAVRNGSVQHHWNFGNMPAQATVTDSETREITLYVRALQREAGIR
ncbi:MAG: cytochrome c, partial [Thermoflexales bacterium]